MLNKYLNSKGFIIFTFVLMCIMLFTQADRQFGYTSSEPKDRANINADGTAYYAYLPKWFIYHNDSEMKFLNTINEKYPGRNFNNFRIEIDPATGRKYNKFFIGATVMQLPFFLVANESHKIFWGNGDGYSLWYRFFIQIGAIFYWLLGGIFLYKFLKQLGNSSFTSILVIAILTFGTNLNFYTSIWVTMPHLYSFTMIAGLMNTSYRWAKESRKWDLLKMMVFIGFIVILRPTDILVVLIIPFFFDNFKSFYNRLKNIWSQNKSELIFAVIAGIVIVFIQLINVYIQIGSFKLSSYGDREGFPYLLAPKIGEVLFGFRKGLFPYAPVLLLLIPGVYFMYKRYRFYFTLGWFFVIFLNLYIISSWWDIYYGGGLGMRPLIDFFPLIAIPIAAMFTDVKSWFKPIIITIGVIGIYIYQIFQLQGQRSILDLDNMNYNHYKRIFLKLESRFEWALAYNQQYLPNKDFVVIDEIRINRNSPVEVIKLDSLKNFTFDSNHDFAELKFKFEPNKFPNTYLGNLMIKIKGECKLSNPQTKPFVALKLFQNENLIQEYVFPFGHLLNDLDEFEVFEVDLNHYLIPEADQFTIVLSYSHYESEYRNVKLQILDVKDKYEKL